VACGECAADGGAPAGLTAVRSSQINNLTWIG
jgi:hypothetical protein